MFDLRYGTFEEACSRIRLALTTPKEMLNFIGELRKLAKIPEGEEPAQATTQQNEEVTLLQKRVDSLQDRLVSLQNELKDAYITGDAEFDQFTAKVRGLDWYYEFSDDRVVYNAGRDRMDELTAIAKEKGGIYLTYFNTIQQRMVGKKET